MNADFSTKLVPLDDFLAYQKKSFFNLIIIEFQPTKKVSKR